MRSIQTYILSIFGALGLLGCHRSNEDVQIRSVVSENYGNLATVNSFVCSGSKPGHLRIFWDIPEDYWGRHRPGCALTLNPQSKRYEAKVSVTTEKLKDGKCRVMLAFGSSMGVANSESLSSPSISGASAGSREVPSDSISFDLPSTEVSGTYNSNIAVGRLLGHDVAFSVDSEYFDYENGRRVKMPPPLEKK